MYRYYPLEVSKYLVCAFTCSVQSLFSLEDLDGGTSTASFDCRLQRGGGLMTLPLSHISSMDATCIGAFVLVLRCCAVRKYWLLFAKCIAFRVQMNLDLLLHWGNATHASMSKPWYIYVGYSSSWNHPTDEVWSFQMQHSQVHDFQI